MNPSVDLLISVIIGVIALPIGNFIADLLGYKNDFTIELFSSIVFIAFIYLIISSIR